MSCSTQKNTWSSRHYQELITRYNVYFNGNESYKEGIEAIRTSHVDNFAQLLPLYPISVHSNANAATSQMTRAIEKGEKAVKSHSIKKKPKIDQKRKKDPKYQLFLAQEEYNPMIDESWMLVGAAQFHKADFLGAVGTFTYVINHFSTDQKIVAKARLWLARSYGELGWYYEAEDILLKMMKEVLPQELKGLNAAVTADLMLKQARYNEALIPLKFAAENEKNKKQRVRFYYVLAQLSALMGNKLDANTYYSKVIKLNPPFDMNFNAIVAKTELNAKSSDDGIKVLRKMLKASKYDSNHDRIYNALGNCYVQNGDKKQAVENYVKCIEIAKDQNVKLSSLVSLADLYYKNSEYIEAQAYYSQAAALMSLDNPDFKRISKLDEKLGELKKNHDVVVLQDSLQALAALPEDQRVSAIDKLIIKLQADEIELTRKLEEEAAADAAALVSSDGVSADESMNSTQSRDWYFYNPALVRAGKLEFKKKWGVRNLEDNWRRTNKMVLALDEIEIDIKTDSTAEQQKKELSMVNTTVNSSPDFYMQQIPQTEAQFSKSNEQIADALLNIGLLYKDDLEDQVKSKETFDELERRFPAYKNLPDVYFYRYQMSLKSNDSIETERLRNQIVAKFPLTDYAKILKYPDFAERLQKMFHDQDSIYQATYLAYLNNDFTTVTANSKLIDEEYPISPLRPKFKFLAALSQGKIGDSDLFKQELQTIVESYPNSDVSAMSKDILALMAQGNISQAGSTHGNMLTKRDVALQQDFGVLKDSLGFEYNTNGKHLVVTMLPKTSETNKLLFDVASYNFVNYLIKDFDIELKSYSTDANLLLVSPFDDSQEAEMYMESFLNDKSISRDLAKTSSLSFVISETNYLLLSKGFTIPDYMSFMKDTCQINQSLAKQKDDKDVPIYIKLQIDQIADKLQPNRPKPIAKVVENNVAKVQLDTLQLDSAKAVSNVETMADAQIFVNNPADTHAYAIIVNEGEFKFDELKSALDLYNTTYFSIANLKVNEYDLNGKKLITISWMQNANAAKSYMFRILRQRSIFTSLSNTNYRSVLISKQNFDKLIQNKAAEEYLEFNRKYNLK